MIRWTLLLSLLLAAAPAAAQGPDPHVLYEERCAVCHDDHAGSFARETVVLRDGAPLTRRGQHPLETFLTRHRGGLEPEAAAAVTDLLARQVRYGGLYEERCRICHESARDLARLTLLVRDRTLIGRYSGREIAAFLLEHGRLDPAEAEEVTEMLTWQRHLLGD